MAGHSKWTNIRFRKGVQDARRGKIFTKLIREISIAARRGGCDVSSNSRLRDSVTKALKANMKRDTIDAAIARGVGGLDNDKLIEMRYEGYGPEGVAILIDCLSDNKNRTVSELRHAFTKYGGNLGLDGSVAYLFNKQGEILLAPIHTDDVAMELAIELGAQDVTVEDGQTEVITASENYATILEGLESAGYEITQSQLTMRARVSIALDKESAETVLRLVDALEDLEDVQEIYCNAEYPTSIFE